MAKHSTQGDDTYHYSLAFLIFF